MSVRVKICGITRIEDARVAVAAGADAIGLVFAPDSPRCLTASRARAICRALPPFVNRVGLFMDQPAAFIHATLETVALDWLQFHGREPQEFCRQFARPWIKALAMGGAVAQTPRDWPDADALLLDSHVLGESGGTGKAFDWQRVPALTRPWILAGGLDADNVAGAIRDLRPDAVDVSSGVEARRGIKSAKLIERFIQAAKNG